MDKLRIENIEPDVINSICSFGIIQDSDAKNVLQLLDNINKTFSGINELARANKNHKFLALSHSPYDISKACQHISTGIFLMPGPGCDGLEIEDLLIQSLPPEFVECTKAYRNCLTVHQYDIPQQKEGKFIRGVYGGVQKYPFWEINGFLSHIKLTHPCFAPLTEFLQRLVA